MGESGMIRGILGNRLPYAISALVPLLIAATVVASPPMTRLRQRESFDFDWKFHLGDVARGQDPNLDSSGWQNISLRHDFSILGTIDEKAPCWGSGGWFPGGVGWYRKAFQLPR